MPLVLFISQHNDIISHSLKSAVFESLSHPLQDGKAENILLSIPFSCHSDFPTFPECDCVSFIGAYPAYMRAWLSRSLPLTDTSDMRKYIISLYFAHMLSRLSEIYDQRLTQVFLTWLLDKQCQWTLTSTLTVEPSLIGTNRPITAECDRMLFRV